MSTMSSIINTSLSGMMTYQTAIAITGENIANAETTGYTRQVVLLGTNSRSSPMGSQTSSGVQVLDVRRAYDQFCQAKVVASAWNLGKLEAEKKYLAYVEAAFDESEGSGLNEALSDFWNSWQDLVNNPSGYTERSTIVSRAAALADNFNQIAAELSRIQRETSSEIAAGVDEINTLISEIAGLNSQMIKAEAIGGNTNTLMDSLDTLTTQLASLIDLNTYQNDDGQVCIQLADGTPLVDGSSSWSMSAETDPATGLMEIYWNDGNGGTISVTEAITGGALGGCLEVRDEIIPGYLSDLDEMAATLMEEINSLLLDGFDLNGQPGVALFTGSGAGDLAVNPDLLSDPSLIAASAEADSAPGDATVALAVAELQDALTVNGGLSSFGDFYSALVGQVGTDVQTVETEYEQQTNLSAFYTNYLASVSGVSTDEEAANLVLFQQALEASARVITILQEIMETIIEM
ncbi:MAG: flagellar hook-associated protein FlgK [Thermodesulfobacteriota bacterium]